MLKDHHNGQGVGRLGRARLNDAALAQLDAPVLAPTSPSTVIGHEPPTHRMVAFGRLVGGLGCATARTALIASGQTLHVAADTFVETAALMDRALDQGAVTPEQYRSWSAFGRRYQVAYPLAVRAWEVARTRGRRRDSDGHAVIAALVSQLADTTSRHRSRCGSG